ncbi:MAG: leucine-rich repeat domain-containing protein [Lachnospiraceae bacterium]|nr:leucine-rich repeat domain-containing protein [Lachnospiraceae bacterium]
MKKKIYSMIGLLVTGMVSGCSTYVNHSILNESILDTQINDRSFKDNLSSDIETLNEFDETTHGAVVKSGVCGAEDGKEDAVKCIRYEDGMIYVYGEGMLSKSKLVNELELQKSTDFDIFIDQGVTLVWLSDLPVKNVYLPESMTVIEDRAFHRCTSLCSIRLPMKLTRIGETAFTLCRSLENIDIPDNVTYIGKNAFASCESLSSINMPEGVEVIEDGAFESCKSLQHIELPKNVKKIRFGAFRDCTSLNSINLPENITFIECATFEGCISLNSIYIPDSVTKIGIDTGAGAFAGCTSLESIYIPESVTSIGDRTFQECEHLTIYAPIGSYAEKYAMENDILFSSFDSDKQ